MSTCRERILSRVAESLQRSDKTPAWQSMSRDEVNARIDTLNQMSSIDPLAASEQSLLPKADFMKAAEAANTKVIEFASLEDLVEYVSALQKDRASPMYFEASDLLSQQNFEHQDISLSSDYRLENQLGVLQAKCAIAETGSIVLTSGPKHATTAGFLLDVLIVLVDANTIVPHLEDIWPLLHPEKALGPVPWRCVNIITGPSRTADVEQKVQLGAHGPRELIVGILR